MRNNIRLKDNGIENNLNRKYVNPFISDGKWYRGNIHTHSIASDGRKTPEKLVEFYKESGYDFLAITDHGRVTDSSGLGSSGFLMIPGQELCVGHSHDNTFYHIVAVGIEKTMPFRDFDHSIDPQDVIDYINERHAIPILAHPYWSGLNHQDMMSLKNIHGVEVYNASCDYERNRGFSGIHIDGIISAGRRPYIYATDDQHGATRTTMPDDIGIGWINVKASSLTVKDIMDSIKKGLFYASMGPEIKEITIDADGAITVKCSPAKYVSFTSSPEHGRLYHAKNDPLTQVTYEGNYGEKYIRIEVTDFEGRTAWSNPIYTN